MSNWTDEQKKTFTLIKAKQFMFDLTLNPAYTHSVFMPAGKFLNSFIDFLNNLVISINDVEKF